MLVRAFAIVPFSLLLAVHGEPVAHGADSIPPTLVPILEQYCVDCHEGARAKGGLDLVSMLSSGVVQAEQLREIRNRLARRTMPPMEEELRPSEAECDAIVEVIDVQVPPLRRELPVVRRLNRAQYAGAVRDTLGVGLDVRTLLPADEVGEGFDTTADTLTLSALLVEKYFDAAERIAIECIPPESYCRTRRIGAEALVRQGSGGIQDGAAWLATLGDLTAEFELDRAGVFDLAITACSHSAGSEVARMKVLVDGAAVTTWEVPQPPAQPGTFAWRTVLSVGKHTVTARFVNDYYEPTAQDPKQRDRNLGIVQISCEGPLGLYRATDFERRAAALAGGGSELTRLRRVAAVLGNALFRREIEPVEQEALCLTARSAAGQSAPWRLQVRALVTALLVDPRFLLRVEAPCASGELGRKLTDSEIASRLSFFLWSSVPDAELQRAALAGELQSDASLRSQVRRMLADVRSESLSTRFATQWLGIDALESKQVDADLYPAMEPALLASMRRETELLFADVVHGRKPARALLLSRTTHVDAALARHYGMRAPIGDGFEELELDDSRVGGVFGHAGVLVATSNPTRTSAVKRGKWVLEALLDEAPPPPPPGVPQLPDRREQREGMSLRQMMEAHRANPDCASCHIRMDALGLAFEKLDVDGRTRESLDGVAIDDSTELANGEALLGADGVAAFVSRSSRFERSLARHLFVYALGRGTSDADDPLLNQLARDLHEHGAFATLVEGIVLSDAFRSRAAMP